MLQNNHNIHSISQYGGLDLDKWDFHSECTRMDGEIDDEVGGGDFDGGELPEVSITCDTGGSGTCYEYRVDRIDSNYCKTYCEESGNPDDYCSSFIIGLIELCELLF